MVRAHGLTRLVGSAVSFSAVVLVLAGCGAGSGDGGSSTSGSKVTVVASFYPLQWMAEQVGGDRVSVSNLTKAGAEPHDLELTPKDVAELADADAVVFLSGFQPAVDEAVKGAGGMVFDAASSARMDRTFGKESVGGAKPGAVDPHFWLDPSRLAGVARSFSKALAHRDPRHGATYRANASRVVAQLGRLDGDFKASLSSCTAKKLVTSHEAFGYLAERYGLEQVGIAGLSPEREPSGADLARVTKFVERNRVRTIYFETLVSPAVAETVASETGARTAVLDPIEGLSDNSQGADYIAVMRSNLKNLQAGQPCS